MSKAKLFDGARFMNDVTNELLKTPIAKETLGDAAGHAANFDVRKVASTLDEGLKKQMDVEFQRLYQTLPSTLFKEALIKFVIFISIVHICGELQLKPLNKVFATNNFEN